MTSLDDAPAAHGIPVRTIEQLTTLRALGALDRFTYGGLAAAAGLRAATVRSLISRWEKEGFRLLEEVGIARTSSVGQPPTIYVRKLRIPLTRDGLETLRAGLRNFFSFPSFTGIDPVSNLLTRCIPFLPGRFQANVRIDAEREPFLPATKTVFPAPPLPAGRPD